MEKQVTPKVTTEEMEVMVRLQENEVKKDRIRRFLKELPEQFSRLEDELATIERRLQEQEARLGQEKKAYRDSEGTLQQKQASVKKSDEKLLSIKNNKEYQAVLTEIEDMKAEIAALEDTMLDQLFAVESAERDLVEARAGANERRERLEEERRELEERQAEDEARLAGLEKEWKELSGQLPTWLLDQYLDIRQTVFDGQAVAAVKNFICQGCNMNIPPQMYNELHTTNVLRFCPFCSRIIYYNGNSQTE